MCSTRRSPRVCHRYAFRGLPPSPYAHPACAREGATQLVLLNLYNATSIPATLPLPSVGRPRREASPPATYAHHGALTTARREASPPATYALWVLSPPEAPSPDAAPAVDPFSERARLNGELLPQRVDGAVANATEFLRGIPVAARTGEIASGLALPPLSISCVCF